MVQRGLLLLALMTALAVTVLVFLNLGGVLGPSGSGSSHSQTALEGPASPVGWEIRYNAAATLARRGSAKVPLDVLCEMLDETQQLRNYRERRQDGTFVTNENEAATTVLSALKAVQDWHKHPQAVKAADPSELERLYAALDGLTRSPNLAVSTRAKEVQLAVKPDRAGAT